MKNLILHFAARHTIPFWVVATLSLVAAGAGFYLGVEQALIAPIAVSSLVAIGVVTVMALAYTDWLDYQQLQR